MPSSPGLLTFLHGTYRLAHPGLGDGTLRQMTLCVHLFERWTGHPLALRHFSDELVRRFVLDYSRTVKPATVNAKLRYLLAMWRCALEEGLVKKGPGRIRRLPENLEEPEAWTLAEVERIVAESRRQVGTVAGLPAGSWWASLLLTIYVTAERIGACKQVRGHDFDPGSRTILFPHTKQRRARRRVLSDQAVAACAAIQDPSRPLFWPWPFSREWLEKSFKRILRRAEVRFGRDQGSLFHKLRRTSGSLVEAAGGDGSRHLGNTRAVFEKHYRDSRIVGDPTSGQVPKLPEVEGPMWYI